jgi:hypothetical protein
MYRKCRQLGPRWAALGIAQLVGSAGVWAQEMPPPPQIPAQEPFGGANLPQAAIPQPTTPLVGNVPLYREPLLEARVQQLEAMVNRLSYQLGRAPAVVAGAVTAPAGPMSGG